MHDTGSSIEARDDTYVFHQTRANMCSGDQFVITGLDDKMGERSVLYI